MSTNQFIGHTHVRVRAGETLEKWGLHAGDIVEVVQIVDAEHISVRSNDGRVTSFWSYRFEPVQAAGRKDDSGKLDMNLLDDMPRALKAVVEVMQWAITEKKPAPYERGSWQGVHADRYRAAVKRHDRDACQQSAEYGQARFERDKETELLHLAHIATSALMALENTIRELEAKNAG